MGNKHTIEYRVDPAVMERLASLEKQLQEADVEAQVKKDPALYRRKEAQIFESFLEGLKNLTLQDVIPRSAAGEKHHIIVGNVSVGKSSLLNVLFGLALSVGFGHTTTEASPVIKDKNNNVVIWDAPGNNQDFKYLDADTLHLFHSADLVFVMFDSSVLACDKVIRTIAQIKGEKCILLMSKCDTILASHQKSLQQEIDTNYQILKSWGITDVKIFPTSSKGGFSNEEVKQMLLGHRQFP